MKNALFVSALLILIRKDLQARETIGAPPSINRGKSLSNLPKIPDGHRQFQFFTLDASGNLQKQWMSLQEVQNIILLHAINSRTNFAKPNYNKPFPLNDQLNLGKDGLYVQRPIWDSSGIIKETSVDQVLANVQKVMSKEMTNTFLRDDFKTTSPQSFLITEQAATSTTNELSAQNITIPDTILADLMRDQVASLETHSPWGIMTLSPPSEVFKRLFQTKEEMIVTTPVTTNGFDDFTENSISNEETTTISSSIDSFPKIDDGMANVNKDEDELMRFDSDALEDDEQITPEYNAKIDTTESVTVTQTLTTIINSNKSSENDGNSYKFDDKNTVVNAPSLLTLKPNLNFKEFNKLETTNSLYEDQTTKTFTTFNDMENADTTNNYSINNPTTTEFLTSIDGELNKGFYNTENTVAMDTTVVMDTTETTPIDKPSFFESTEIDRDQISMQTTNYDDDATEPETTPTTTYPPSTMAVKKIEKSSMIYAELLNEKPNNVYIKTYNEKENIPTSNVLTPSEIAQVPNENVATLGVLGGKTESADYSANDPPLYLEDLTEVVYDYEDIVEPTKNEQYPSSTILDFPSPDVTNSYAQPDHVANTQNNVVNPSNAFGELDNPASQSSQGDTNYDDVDPTQFLPAFNPIIANKKNPLLKTPEGNLGLELTVLNLDSEVRTYIDAMNEISFQVYKEALSIHRRQNLVMSPLNLISSLSILSLGARHTTADDLTKLLKTEDFMTFNPHLLLKNITDNLLALNDEGHEVAFVNSICIEAPKKKLYSIDFFSRTLEYFYNAIVEQVPKEEFGAVARDRSNERIRNQTSGSVHNFLKPQATLKVFGPLSLVSSSYFEGNWAADIQKVDLVDMNFIRFPSAEKRASGRRLIKTVGLNKRMKINAGYSEEMDATVAEIPLSSPSNEISMILVMPGEQKNFIANGLAQLEQSLTVDRWGKLLRAVVPHTIHFKMPIFSHRNYLNLSEILSRVGLSQLFKGAADFSGINGLKNLHLGDVVQLTEFHSCKLEMKSLMARSLDLPQLNTKFYEENPEKRTSRNIRSASLKPLNSGSLNVGKRGETEKTVQKTYRSDNTLAYDRAFFYVLRHNPTGLILFIGRYLDPETF